MIRHATSADAAAITEIYNHYVLTHWATLEWVPIPVSEMEARIQKVQEEFPWLVAEEDGIILGYAYAGQFRGRVGYRHTAETSIYLNPEQHKKGIGSQLYEELFRLLEKMDVHKLIAGIGLPNEASVAFHQKHGFVKVAHFTEMGRKFNKWWDVSFWERPVVSGDTSSLLATVP